MRARKSVIAGTVLLLILGATGCATQGQTTLGAPPPRATAGPAAGSATTTTFGSGESLVYDCGQLVDPQSLAQLDPSLSADKVVTPASGSSAEEALAISGTACSWSDPSSQTTLVVTAAKPDATTFTTLKEKASTGPADTEFGKYVTAYVNDSQVQLFTSDGAWATADSALFADPAKITLIGQVLLEELPAG